MFIETSAPQKMGQKAWLISPVESVSGFHSGLCLYFYYHAYGKDIGSMNVYSIKESDYQSNVTALNPLWNIDRNLSDQWFIASVSTDFKEDYRIVFEGIVGRSLFGDVAIDDVFLSPRSCPIQGSCDFENGNFDFCSWLNTENRVDDFDWRIYSPTIAAELNEPVIFDNTLGDENGRFMIASDKSQGRVAKIYSEKLDSTSSSGSCLSFYYYFNGG